MSNHNRLYEVFVEEDESTIRGLVAYGLYKQAKREWAKEIWATHKRAPRPAELKSYIATWTPSQIQGKRTEATSLLTQFSDEIVESLAPQIRADALRGRFWPQVGSSVLANILYTLLLVAVAAIITFLGIDIVDLVRDMASKSAVSDN